MKFLLIFLTALYTVVVDSSWFSAEPQIDHVVPEANWPDVQKTEIQMPGVLPQYNDTYLCTAFPLSTDETHYIVGFEPMADMHQVHHIIMYGCEEPGTDEEVWDCGEMGPTNGRYDRSPICSSSPNILYAWAMGAPKLELPKGVGFRVGAETNNRYVVLQVHYMHGSAEREDNSGVRISSTIEPMPRTAATLLMASDGQMEPKKTEQLEVACIVDEPIEMHPFAYRVHTHRHGQKVSGWVVEEDPINGEDKWNLLGERNPQLPQLFDPVKNESLIISQGDILAARCTIKNEEKRLIKIGPTGEDEMCNFYLMYWVEGDRVLEQNTCFSAGAPSYRWSNSAGLNHIPKTAK
jgi:peptidylglycine monooxygenase